MVNKRTVKRILNRAWDLNYTGQQIERIEIELEFDWSTYKDMDDIDIINQILHN